MFQHLGAGYAALLIYMSDEDDRRVWMLFVKRRMEAEHSLTWAMLPGDDSRLSVEMVCMESMMTMSGRVFLMWT